MRIGQYKKEHPAPVQRTARKTATPSMECEWNAHEWCDGGECDCECHPPKRAPERAVWLPQDEQISDHCHSTTGHLKCNLGWCACKCHQEAFLP